MPEPEKRDYKIKWYRAEHGRSCFWAICPFCGETVQCHIWSLSGCGRRCPKCKAMFSKLGFASAPEPATKETRDG